jgi:hypothetical protein
MKNRGKMVNLLKWQQIFIGYFCAKANFFQLPKMGWLLLYAGGRFD